MEKTILSKLKFELSEAKILARYQIWKWFCGTIKIMRRSWIKLC